MTYEFAGNLEILQIPVVFEKSVLQSLFFNDDSRILVH